MTLGCNDNEEGQNKQMIVDYGLCLDYVYVGNRDSLMGLHYKIQYKLLHKSLEEFRLSVSLSEHKINIHTVGPVSGS